MYTVLAIFQLLFHPFADSLSLWGPLGWVTLIPIVKSGPNFNLSEILCLSLLFACSMEIQLKMKSGQHLPHYMSVGD